MSKAMRCRMKIGLSSTPGSHSMAPCRRRHLAQSCFGLFYFGISIPFRNCGPKFSPATVGSRFPPVGSRISDGKNGGRASKGDCRSAGAPLRGACLSLRSCSPTRSTIVRREKELILAS